MNICAGRGGKSRVTSHFIVGLVVGRGDGTGEEREGSVVSERRKEKRNTSLVSEERNRWEPRLIPLRSATLQTNPVAGS